MLVKKNVLNEINKVYSLKVSGTEEGQKDNISKFRQPSKLADKAT